MSNAKLTLQNYGGKYDGLFDDMDRIVIYLRRFRKMLVFSGYLDIEPAFTVYARTVTLQASCTLKRIQNWLWDPGTGAANDLLYSSPTQTDMDLSRKIIALMTKVVGWDTKKIHLGRVPPAWFTELQGVADQLIADAQNAELAKIVGSDSYLNGDGSTGNMTSPDGIGPGTGTLPTTSGRATTFGGGPLTHPPSLNDPGAHGGFALTGEKYPNYHDLYYCAMRWPYLIQRGYGDIRPAPGVDTGKAVAWWKNRLILVTNPANGRSVVCRAADWGPSQGTGGAIDLGPAAMAYLANSSPTKIGAIDNVRVAFAAPGSTVGPVSGAAAGLSGSLGDVGTVGTAAARAQAVAGAGGSVGQQVIIFAQTLLGTPYLWGGDRPGGFDCSGLVEYVFGHFGYNFGRVTTDQEKHGTEIPVSQTQAGDLIFYGAKGATHHVGIAMGNGMMLAAPHTGDVVKEQPIYQSGDGPWAKRVLGAPGGIAKPVGASTDASTTATTGAGADVGTGNFTAQDVATALFNIWAWQAQVDPLSDALGGAKALMNDHPIFETVASLLTAGMREFCSAPNGDFIAWFPDYFGHYGTAARLTVRDIELRRDFAVAKSDVSLRTHWFVTSQSAPGQGSDIIGPEDVAQIFSTAGVASVEFPQLMKAIFGVTPTKENGLDAATILQKLGARQEWEQMPNISGHRQEFFFAVMHFARNWAQRYSTQIPLTFMPEAWPGMLLQLPQYGFQAYIQQVQHNFNLQTGGGFSTDVSVIACSSLGDAVLPNLPKGGLVKA